MEDVTLNESSGSENFFSARQLGFYDNKVDLNSDGQHNRTHEAIKLWLPSCVRKIFFS